MTKTLHIPMLGFVNLKAGGILTRSKTLQPLFPISLILISTVIVATVTPHIPTFPRKVCRNGSCSEFRISGGSEWESADVGRLLKLRQTRVART